MSDREKFETWAKTSDGNCNDRDLERRHDGDYHNMLVQRDWEVWQASRRAALEEAAQVAYAHNAIMATTTAQLIENAIRALAEGDKQ